MPRVRRCLILFLVTLPLLQAGGLDCSQRAQVALADGFFLALRPWLIEQVTGQPSVFIENP